MVLSHVSFLIDYMSKRNLAYEQLLEIELNYSNLDALDCYKIKKMKELLDKEEEDSPSSRMTSDAFTGAKAVPKAKRNALKIPKVLKEKLMVEFSSLMEKSATELIYLWQTLLGENPQVSKVYSGMQDSVKSVEASLKFWSKNSKFLDSVASSMEMYGRFLRDVVDQKEMGDKIILEAYSEVRKAQSKMFQIENLSFTSDLENLQLPCFILRKKNMVRQNKLSLL